MEFSRNRLHFPRDNPIYSQEIMESSRQSPLGQRTEVATQCLGVQSSRKTRQSLRVQSKFSKNLIKFHKNTFQCWEAYKIAILSLISSWKRPRSPKTRSNSPQAPHKVLNHPKAWEKLALALGSKEVPPEGRVNFSATGKEPI